MASRKITNEPINNTEEENKIMPDKNAGEVEIKAVKSKKTEDLNKYKIGDIVFISKDAEADLNGFKLFPPYKKYTYTVEAYEPKSGIYSLRRLNLSLKLKEADIVAPNERAHDALNKKQF